MTAMDRRDFIKTIGAGAAAAMLPGCGGPGSDAGDGRPNIIYILADDLGYGELGCFGQEKIRTPNIDRLAAEGMRFVQHYSGSTVCAPSRCCLLTGQHTGHAYIRGNDEMNARGDVWNDPEIEGQRPLLAGTATLGGMLQKRGYTTAAVGKWGLGWTGSSGDPNEQGFDHFFGYICQREAHNYYPTHLWRNGRKHVLENLRFKAHQKLAPEADPDDRKSYEKYAGKDYALDCMTDEALGFIEENARKPFFLYLAYPVPHVALQVPEDSLEEYAGAFPETPYLGDKGYLPHRTPRAAYAAMITRMDDHIGRILALLKELGLDEQTAVFFSSDNGPTYAGGVDAAFFESAGALRGLKGSLFEGGIRVPFIARWPGKIAAGAVSDHVSAFWDVLPTFADLTGATLPLPSSDGISFVPTLLGSAARQQRRQQQHDYLYWEYRGRQAVRRGDFKGYRPAADKPLELYDLRDDLEETTDVAAAHPTIANTISRIMNEGRTESKHFPLVKKNRRK